MSENIDDKLKKLESELIQQEHRPLKVFKNYFISRKKWPKGDRRRSASLWALIWAIFFSSGTVAITGGVLGVISLCLFFRQNDIMADQNKFLQQQILLNEISDDKVIIYGDLESFPSGRKRSSLENLIRALRAINGDSVIKLTDVDLSEVDLTGLDLSNIDFSGSDFRGANLNNSDFRNSILANVKFGPAERVSTDSTIIYRYTSAQYVDFRNAKLEGIKAPLVNFSYSTFTENSGTSDDLPFCLFYGCNQMPFNGSTRVRIGGFAEEIKPYVINVDDAEELLDIFEKEDFFMGGFSISLYNFKQSEFILRLYQYRIHAAIGEEGLNVPPNSKS